MNRSPNPTAATATSDPAGWREIDLTLNSLNERIVRTRRRIHATPEISGAEHETTAIVAELLREAGLDARIMQDGVGVVADIDLGAPHQTFIALRAELDAVGVNDDKQTPYASTHAGLCHACGHDAHASMVLAAALAVAEHTDQLRTGSFHHNLRFVFQPAEETATGARQMISQGAIDGVEGILALHVDPMLDAGTLGFRYGPLTAACKTFTIRVRGRSGHSARPHEAIDPIPAAVNIISQFYQLAPRSMDSRYPLSLTVASINAGHSSNAIPDESVLQGTLRTTRPRDLEVVQRRMEAICEGVARATGAQVHLDFLHTAPATDNDQHLTDALVHSTEAVLSEDAIQWLDVPSLGGEDFAFYQELIPGAIVRLGTGNDSHTTRHPLHSSQFDIDESTLLPGAKILTRAALSLAAA